MSWKVTFVCRDGARMELVDVAATTVGVSVLEARLADGRILGIPLGRVYSYELLPMPDPPPVQEARDFLASKGWGPAVHGEPPRKSLEVVGGPGGKATVEVLE